MQRSGLVVSVLMLGLALAGCDSRSEADRSDAAKAQQDIHHAGNEVDAGVDRLGAAATAAADSADHEGRILLRQGRKAVADAADDVSAKASDAARDLRH
jgi:hypothetical protein